MIGNEKTLSLTEKLQHALTNMHLLPPLTLKQLQSIRLNPTQQLESHPTSFSSHIQIETFYRLTIPSWMHLDLESCSFLVEEPVLAIVAFPHLNGYHSISRPLITWAQSGGAKVIPLPISASPEKIKQILSNSHGLIIPHAFEKINTQLYSVMVSLLENESMPIIAIGNSAFEMTKIEKAHSSKSSNNNETGSVFLSYHHYPFADLDLNLRINLENKSLIPISNCPAWKDYPSKLQILGAAKGKNEDWKVVVGRSQNMLLLFENWVEEEGRVEKLCEKLIINFVDEIRGIARKLSEESVNEVQKYKLVLGEGEEKAHFNVDLKLAKLEK